MKIGKLSAGLCGLLAAAACEKASNRADPDMSTGGAGGSGVSGSGAGGAPEGGSGGAGTGAGSGGLPADGGSGGMTSASGSGGVAVDASTDVGRPLEPIRVSEARTDSSSSYSNLRIVGAGLDQYEGAVVTFRIGSGSGAWRTGSGQVRIAQGGFDVVFTGVLAPTYESKIVHIDADGSGACEVGEPAFFDSTLFQSDATLTVTPSDARFRAAVSGWCDAVNTAVP